jgi:putative Mg2+ transporter-C (MgtC) family protein
MPSFLELIGRLALAGFLGGVIGYERERTRHPAGFRTHILVCVGSALVMLSNIYIFEQYRGHANIDPGRFGAQVISGIGFLGAGTILKEGVNVKGLTTAASLWTVACIGIAVGLGFYSGSILTTVLVILALVVLSKTEGSILGSRKNAILKIRSEDKPGQIGKIGTKLGLFNLNICDISIELEDENSIIIKMRINKPKGDLDPEVVECLCDIEGILEVEVC